MNKNTGDGELRLAMTIVNFLGDMWAVPVADRQNTNDKADEIVAKFIAQEANKELVELSKSFVDNKDYAGYMVKQVISARGKYGKN